jgi:hypothetical protein
MYREGGESWRAGITTSPFLAHIALYVRDACGLEVPGDSFIPPRLLGGVVDHSGALTAEIRKTAGEQWLSWWQAIIAVEGAQQLGTLQLPAAGFERLEALVAAQESLLDWPELDVLADRSALRDAVRVSYEDASRWQSECSREVARARPTRAEFGHDAFRPIAESLKDRLGLAPGRLRAGVLVVAVEGKWSVLAASGVLCCSPTVVADFARYRALVEAAFVSGLEAVEVPLPAYQRKSRSLPPSVLSEPLVIWSGPELGLACERVIPYPDGFEIELRRTGGMPPPTVPAGTILRQPRQHDPWERPDRFVGLEVSVTFANGLHVVRNDLAGADQQENFALVLSRFWRKETDADTLWLWVAPLPPEGEVMLTVSWPSYGIESAAVRFEGSLVGPARAG